MSDNQFTFMCCRPYTTFQSRDAIFCAVRYTATHAILLLYSLSEKQSAMKRNFYNPHSHDQRLLCSRRESAAVERNSSQTTCKNARSQHQRAVSPLSAQPDDPSSCRLLAVDAKFTTAARRRRLFHNNVANRRHRSQPVRSSTVIFHRLLATASDERAADDGGARLSGSAASPAARRGTEVKVTWQPLAPWRHRLYANEFRA